MSVVRAIFEHGIFRPTSDVKLPERAEVEFEPRLVIRTHEDEQALDDIYEVKKNVSNLLFQAKAALRG